MTEKKIVSTTEYNCNLWRKEIPKTSNIINRYCKKF